MSGQVGMIRKAVIRGGLNGQTIFNNKDFDMCRNKGHRVRELSLTPSVKIKLYI